MAQSTEPGLYIVATPIGNLSDVTHRSVDVLARADVVLCEDSRITGKLLSHLGLKKRMIAYHDHKDATDRAGLVAMMADRVVALVSDAGTPLISDPGYKLVRDARAAGVSITSLPGANAAIVALTLSGLPTDRFFFAGFLPQKSGARRRELDGVKSVEATLLFYESGRRLAASLSDMAEALGDRPCAVVREISKAFEETVTGSLCELALKYQENPPKGEIVVVIGGPVAGDAAAATDADIDAALVRALEGMPPARAAREISRQFGKDRSDIYRRALELKDAG